MNQRYKLWAQVNRGEGQAPTFTDSGYWITQEDIVRVAARWHVNPYYSDVKVSIWENRGRWKFKDKLPILEFLTQGKL